MVMMQSHFCPQTVQTWGWLQPGSSGSIFLVTVKEYHKRFDWRKKVLLYSLRTILVWMNWKKFLHIRSERSKVTS